MAEGWSLTWEYLWHAEHGLLLLWGLGAGLAVLRLRRQRQRDRAWYWLFTVSLLYGWLVLTSTILQRFVVYGRLVRPLVPFLALAAAYGLMPLLTGREARAVWLRRGLIVFIMLQAAWNFYTPLIQVFPREFVATASADCPDAAIYSTIHLYDPRLPIPDARCLITNVMYLYPVQGHNPMPEGTILYSAPQPVSYDPYLYEGHTPEERAIIRTGLTDMMLIEQSAP